MSYKQRILTSGLWVTVSLFLAKSLALIKGIILARILEPEDFGLLAIVMVFVNLAHTVANTGFMASLVQAKKLDKIDRDTAFWSNLTIAVILGLLVYIFSPSIANFYTDSRLEPILKFLCVTPVINAMSGCQKIQFHRDLNFKALLLKVEFPVMFIGLTIAWILALLDFGVWALVYSQMFTSVMSVTLLWFISSWRPSLRFSSESFRKMANFAGALTFTATVDKVFNQLYPLIIGKLFSAVTLGFYQRAHSLQIFPAMQIYSIIDKLTFPLFSQVQDDLQKLRKGFNVGLTFIGLSSIPLFCYLSSGASYIIPVLLSDKWMPAVKYFQPLCLIGALYPINALNLSILRSTGRTKELIHLSLIKRGLTIAVLILTYKHGVLAMVYGQTISAIIAVLINNLYTRKIIEFGLRDHLKVLWPFLLLACLIFTINCLIVSALDSINPILALAIISLISFIIFWAFIKVVAYPNKNYIKSLLLHDSRLKKMIPFIF